MVTRYAPPPVRPPSQAELRAAEFYTASPIKRHRATKAEVEERRASLFEIVAEMKPMTVRQVFYQATVRNLVEKSEVGYAKVQTDLVPPGASIAAVSSDGAEPGGRRAHGERLAPALPPEAAPPRSRRRSGEAPMSAPVFEMLRAVAPHGTLRRHLPTDAKWQKSIGGDVILLILTSRTPPPQQLQMLADTFHLASVIAQQATEAAQQRRRIRAPVLFTRDPAARRWRRRTVPIAEAFIVSPEGEA
jgi:hypothetical protein